MDDTGSRQRLIAAISLSTVTTRGQRIRRERNLRRLTMAELAAAVGISERTLRSIETDERPDARTIDLVESYLGLDQPTPRTQSPPLDKATHEELVLEIYRRLHQLPRADPGDGSIPGDVQAESDLILGPPDEAGPPQACDPPGAG